jgi:hypothetical protein
MNNKDIYTILIALAVVLLVSACGTTDTSTTPGNTDVGENAASPESTVGNTGENTQPVQNGVKTQYGQLFDYAKTNNFQYRISTNINEVRNTIDIDYVVTSDSSTGTNAWLVSTTSYTEAGVLKTNMWIDKNTYKCIKWESVIENGDQRTVQPGGCPLSGLNSESYGAGDLVSMSQEEINVPAGIFNANRYEQDGITFWTDPSVGVPVKIIYNDGTVKMVLMKYS